MDYIKPLTPSFRKEIIDDFDKRIAELQTCKPNAIVNIQIDIDMPEGCQKCKFFKKHIFGNGLDCSYSCMLGAKKFPMPWIKQLEERARDCPLQKVR